MKKRLFLTILMIMVISFVFAQSNQIQPRKIIVVPDEPSNLEASINVDRGEGSVYQPGELISIQFRTNKDAYVVIYDIMPNGNTHILFPNRYEKDNFVPANTTREIPRGYKLKLGNDTGKEYLQIVASTKQFAKYNAWTQSFSSSPFPMVTKNAESDLKAYTRSIIVEPDNNVPEWTSNTTFFYVGQSPKNGTVNFRTNPSGAAIWLDGNWINKSTPYKNTLAEGYHYVRFYKNGYKMHEEDFYLSAGGFQQIDVNLTPLTTQYGKLTVNSLPPNASVYLDGNLKGKAPMTINNITPGNHTLELHLSGYNDAKQDFYLNPGEHKNVTVTMSQQVSKGTVNINTYPTRTNVIIDGQSYNNTTGQVQVQLKSGTHNLNVSAQGYESKSMQFNLNPGEFKQINVQLQSAMSNINIYSNPSNARVYVDGNDTGYYTGRTFTLSPGYHQIKITKQGYREWTTTVNLNPGKNNDLTANLVSLKGTVSMNIPTDCKLFIDGNMAQELSGGRSYNFELAPGIHEFVFIKSGYYIYSERINVSQGGNYSINPILNSIQ